MVKRGKKEAAHKARPVDREEINAIGAKAFATLRMVTLTETR
jgi:hypothetical protein